MTVTSESACISQKKTKQKCDITDMHSFHVELPFSLSFTRKSTGNVISDD